MTQFAAFFRKKNMTAQVMILAVLACFQATMAQAVGTVSASGYILRDTSLGQFEVTVKVTSVENKDPFDVETGVFEKSRIKFFLQSKSTSVTVPYEGEADSVDVPFHYRSLANAIVTAEASNRYTLTFKFLIYQDFADGLKNLLNGASSTKITVQYYEKGVKVGEPVKDIEIKVNNAVVQDAPTSFKALGGNQALLFNWGVPGDVKFSDGSSYGVSKIVVVAIDREAVANGLSLPARLFDASKTADDAAAEGSCQFNSNAESGSQCVTCSSANHYLDTAALAAMDDQGVFVVESTKASSGGAGKGSLTNGVEYAAFAYFEPGGLTRTACVNATPQVDFTLSELNGEDEAKWDSPRCFIATAAYGSPLHKNIGEFVWFRDHVLARTKAGQRFIDWYYVHGPRYAQLISEHPTSRFFVRLALWPQALAIKTWRLMFDESQKPQGD